MAENITSKIVNNMIVVNFVVDGALNELKFAQDAKVDDIKLAIAQFETNLLVAKKTVQDMAKVVSVDAAAEIEAKK